MVDSQGSTAQTSGSRGPRPAPGRSVGPDQHERREVKGGDGFVGFFHVLPQGVLSLGGGAGGWALQAPSGPRSKVRGLQTGTWVSGGVRRGVQAIDACFEDGLGWVPQGRPTTLPEERGLEV